MKKNAILTALLLLVAGMQSAFAQKVVLNFPNGESIKYYVDELESITFEEANDSIPQFVDGYECVDLGLPSHTLWATINVGAETPEGFGNYYSWGETETEDIYYWETYNYSDDRGSYISKYCIDENFGSLDNKTVLEAGDDAATAKWGNLWQMPLYEQIEELKDTCYTTIEWTFQNEVAGILVTSKVNGNSIFLPAAGNIQGNSTSYVGEYGFYWSRSLYSKNDVSAPSFYAERLLFNSNGCFPSRYYGKYIYAPLRYLGHPVRPVVVQRVPYPWPISQIELSYSELLLDRTNATKKLIPHLTPSYAKPKIAWESSDENVAQVGDDGLVTVVGEGTCTITCRATDINGASATCQVTVLGEGRADGHNWVDLGLPSGTLWATCNLGANSPGENGDYYAWGETLPKDDYTWETYRFCEDTYNSMTKYNVIDRFGKLDYMTWLKPTDDAAYTSWSNCWQMPSEEQLEELMNSEYTDYAYVGKYKTFGIEITSKINGRSIFLPMPGHYTGTEYFSGHSSGDTYDCSAYLTRSLDKNQCNTAICLSISHASAIMISHVFRFYGYSIRPVRYKDVTYVNRIVLDQSAVCLEPGETITLSAEVYPANAANKDVLWTSDNQNVASVDAEGKVTANTLQGIATITCYAADGSGPYAHCDVALVMPCPDNNHPHLIDLGLPSGTKWSCCNVGSDMPEEYGGYFAWGETTTKSDYGWNTYKYCDGTSSKLTKYCNDSKYGIVDNKTELDPEDDAAYDWHENWYTPSKEQCQELLNNSKRFFGWKNEVYGMYVVSKNNGNNIFLPAQGERYYIHTRGKGQSCYYWSRTLSNESYSHSQYAVTLGSSETRDEGLPVRAVDRR